MQTMEEKRFIDNGNGTVTDTERNLMWKQTDAFQDEENFILEQYYKAVSYTHLTLPTKA